MTIKQEVGARELEDMTWQCEEFWEVVNSQNLEGDLESYLDEMFPDGEDLTAVNDLLRFDGESVLQAIGADLTGTIWDEDA